MVAVFEWKVLSTTGHTYRYQRTIDINRIEVWDSLKEEAIIDMKDRYMAVIHLWLRMYGHAASYNIPLIGLGPNHHPSLLPLYLFPIITSLGQEHVVMEVRFPREHGHFFRYRWPIKSRFWFHRNLQICMTRVTLCHGQWYSPW